MKTAVTAVMMTLMAVSIASGNLRVYAIDPVRADWSGKADPRPDHGVSEVLTCNFDELDTAAGGYAELFVGDYHDTTSFNLNIYDYPGGVQPVASAVGQHPTGGHTWLRFPVVTASGKSFTKGKQYEFRFTRSGSDSIMYYWQETPDTSVISRSPYPYGFLLVNGQGDSAKDLACRVYGRMKAVDSLNFGADEASWHLHGPSGHMPWPNRDTFACNTESAGVGTVRLEFDWKQVQEDSANDWDYALLDSTIQTFTAAGCRILALLVRVPQWASTRVVNGEWSEGCPPRGLQYSYNDPRNSVGRFLIAAVQHCDNRGFAIHDWEVLNEVNSEETLPPINSYWQHPNFYYTGDSADYVGPGLHDMCSLYVRMALVVDSAIRSDPEHQNDRIALNSVNWVNTPDEGAPRYSGKEWLREFYDIMDGRSIPHFWDAVSAHPYRETIPPLGMSWPFSPHEFETQAETLRRIMRQHGDYGELWNTEFSMPGLCWWVPDTSPYWQYTVSTPEQSGDYYCEMLATTEGMKAIPAGGFDRSYWWLLRQPPLWGWGCWALMDSALSRHAEYCAFKQTTAALTGKRFNGRVMTGDARDDSVRMYEFEDPATLKRTWVCWKNGDTAGGSVSAKLPVRVDTVAGESLAYSDSTAAFLPAPGSDGWLPFNLTERPVFITEGSDTVLRPDLRVDSAKYAVRQGQARVQAWVTNHGTRGTPSDQTQTPYPTVAELYGNGTYIQRQERTTTIPRNEQVSFQFNLGQPTSDTVLYSVQVNPAQTYVELSTDDNAGYRLKTP